MSTLKDLASQLLREMEEEARLAAGSRSRPAASPAAAIPPEPAGNPRARLSWATAVIAPRLLANESPGASGSFALLRELALRRDRSGAYAVYVLMLDAAARRSRHGIPGQEGMPCVYVGQTSKGVAARYEDHLAGYKSRVYIRNNLVGLLPGVYERYNPLLDQDTALAAEAALAEALRLIGCTVFGGH
jgi:hypothetical protein